MNGAENVRHYERMKRLMNETKNVRNYERMK